jgi:hypothetical protein
MSVFKYRVHEVGKDFNVSSKDIMTILSKYSGDVKNHMAALGDKELNIIFDFYTQNNAVENFDEYFKTQLTNKTEIK